MERQWANGSETGGHRPVNLSFRGLRQGAQQGFTLLELVVVSVLIGVLFVSAMSYYFELMQDARKASVGLLASRFTAATSGAHLQWTIAGRPQSINFDGFQLRMNRYGWPIGEVSGEAQGFNICRQLWESLLQNPAVIPDTFPVDKGDVTYWVDAPNQGVCRYRLMTKRAEEYYFEYSLTNGKVTVGENS
jgi:prepilin-type N-terminal cleavage/methylation domain-containing protein